MCVDGATDIIFGVWISYIGSTYSKGLNEDGVGGKGLELEKEWKGRIRL